MPYTVAVRALCEFTAKQGDLDARFAPSPSAQEGIEGHAWVTARRGPSYESELSLSGTYRHLHVRGRADGYDSAANRLEEIKTHRGRLDRQPDNHRRLHWAQAKLYGWLVCQQRGLEQIQLALVYIDIATREETHFVESWSADELRRHFEQCCTAFLAWAEQEASHRANRDQALSDLRFPHPDFRHGQRPLAEAVFRTARAGRRLMAQAPTGIGKTIGTLFGLLKAAPAQRIDKIFFLTAKTSGRALALDALAMIRAAEPACTLRAIELVARDKACEHPDKACHGDSCPLARGFYDRLPVARQAAVMLPVWDKTGLRAVALEHGICPYHLGQELVRWADVVVGDYNHYFDLYALLHGLALANQWKVGLLVDEAHNLLERSRSMYSAELDQDRLSRLRRTAPAALERPLGRIDRQLNALGAALQTDYQSYPALPTNLLPALQQAVSAITELSIEDPGQLDASTLEFLFDALHFGRLAETLGEHSLVDATRTSAGRMVLCIRNVIPAPFVGPRLAAAQSAILFSATLQPAVFYRDMLGLSESTGWIEVDSPFDAQQLAVHIARDISTRFAHRATSVAPIVALIKQQIDERPGNYLAFFSSFEYLDSVAKEFEACHPQVAVWKQSRRMSEPERTQFLERFVVGGRGVGFAVLGGAFAEGVDLPGERLIGAFIATLGLPAVNPVNEQIKQRIEQACGAGFDYTYLYPGLQKVVQAAGRVIRTPSDRGVVHLVDDRFMRPSVRRLLPGWWELDSAPRVQPD